MHGQMRLTDYDYSADSIWGEFVERYRPDLSVGAVSCFYEDILQLVDVGDCVITARNFNDIVNTFWGQFRISASRKMNMNI